MNLSQQEAVNKTTSKAAAENNSGNGIALPAVAAFRQQPPIASQVVPPVQRMKINPGAAEFAAFKKELRDLYIEQFDEPETSNWDAEAQEKLAVLFRANGLAAKVPLISQPEPMAVVDTPVSGSAAASSSVLSAPPPPPLPPVSSSSSQQAPLVPMGLAFPPMPVDDPAYKENGVLHNGRYYAHVAFSNKGWTDLLQKGPLKGIIMNAAGANREEVINFVIAAYEKVAGREPQWDKEDLALFETQAALKIPAYKSVSGLHRGALLPHWPAVPAALTKVEKSTVETFRNFAMPGSAFTGLVKFSARNPETEAPVEPFIYLHPTQATGDYLKSGILPHSDGPNDSGELVEWNERGKELPDILKNATIHGKKPGYYSTHQGQDKSSHMKIQDMAEAGPGLGIGFTVIRGGRATQNKYTFVSRSNNVQTFSSLSPTESRLPDRKKLELKLERNMGEGLNEPPTAWAGHIVGSVDAVTQQ